MTINNSRKILYTFLSIILFLSCNSETSKQLELDTKLSFDGASVKKGKIENISTDNYEIEITLRDKDTNTDFKFSESTPPMPFSIGGWALMKKGANNYFLFNSKVKLGTNISFDSNWHSIKIVATNTNNETRFYLDGKLVSVKPFFTRLKTFYNLGKGYNKRYWSGDIHSCHIINLSNNKILFQLKKPEISTSES